MQVPSVPVPPPPLIKLPQINNNQQTFVQKSTLINIYICIHLERFRQINLVAPKKTKFTNENIPHSLFSKNTFDETTLDLNELKDFFKLEDIKTNLFTTETSTNQTYPLSHHFQNKNKYTTACNTQYIHI